MAGRTQDGPLTIGENFLGKYEIVKLIGRGGNACVYEALHKFMGKRVALKVLHRPGGLTREALQRGQAEAQLMNAIRHQHIVEVSDAGLTGDGTLYIVMELLEGRNLRETLSECGTLAVEEALLLCAQIAEGTHAAHLAGAIHRDLKPDNAFITTGNRVKVLDFGVMKLVDAAAWSTQKGIAHGTPLYMSPEQLHLRPVGPTSDIYTLGLILYEALIGRHPVYLLTDTLNPTLWEIGRVASNMVPPRVDQLDPRLPTEVGLLVERALAKAPQKRFATMEEFAKAMLDCRANWLDFARRSGIPLAERDLSRSVAVQQGVTTGGTAVPDTKPVSRPMFLGSLSSTSRMPHARVPEAAPFTGYPSGPRTEIIDGPPPPPPEPLAHQDVHAPPPAAGSSAPTSTMRYPPSPTPGGVGLARNTSNARASFKALPYFLAGLGLAGAGGAAYWILAHGEEPSPAANPAIASSTTTLTPAVPGAAAEPAAAAPERHAPPALATDTAPAATDIAPAAPPSAHASAAFEGKSVAVPRSAATRTAAANAPAVPRPPASSAAVAESEPSTRAAAKQPAPKEKGDDDLEDLLKQTERKLQAEEKKQRGQPQAR